MADALGIVLENEEIVTLGDLQQPKRVTVGNAVIGRIVDDRRRFMEPRLLWRGEALQLIEIGP